jgi:hypothetical protein
MSSKHVSSPCSSRTLRRQTAVSSVATHTTVSTGCCGTVCQCGCLQYIGRIAGWRMSPSARSGEVTRLSWFMYCRPPSAEAHTAGPRAMPPAPHLVQSSDTRSGRRSVSAKAMPTDRGRPAHRQAGGDGCHEHQRSSLPHRRPIAHSLPAHRRGELVPDSRSPPPRTPPPAAAGQRHPPGRPTSSAPCGRSRRRVPKTGKTRPCGFVIFLPG